MIDWKPISEKPKGPERKVLLWVEDSLDTGWFPHGGPKIGWWKHGPGVFAFGKFEDLAGRLATHWAEITKPGEPSLEKVYQEAIETLSCKLAMHINKTKQMGETEVALMARIFELEQKIVKLEKRNEAPKEQSQA